MKTKAEFTDNKGFNVKLTDDKIYVSSIGNEETFALRSVNGVGLYDDIDKYNTELKDYNKKNNIGCVYSIGAFGVILGILFIQSDSIGLGLFIMLLCIVGAYFMNIGMNKRKTQIKLDSYFRLMLSGGSREFKFDKSDENSVEIADFINKIEDTLTSYK